MTGHGTGILRFLGPHHAKGHNRCGVKLDKPTGNNAGTVDGHKYFVCKPNYGILVKLNVVRLAESRTPSPSSDSSNSDSGSSESVLVIETEAVVKPAAQTPTVKKHSAAPKKASTSTTNANTGNKVIRRSSSGFTLDTDKAQVRVCMLL